MPTSTSSKLPTLLLPCVCSSDESAYLDYIYKLRSSDYRVDFTIRGHELRRFLPVNIALQDIEWRQRIPQQEQSWKFEGQYSGIYYHYPQGDVDLVETTSEANEEYSKRRCAG